jgi:uncharacterized protein (DUF1330 family)
MPAYVIADIDIHDPETYQEYAAQVLSTLKPFGGRHLVRSDAVETLEGDWHPRRLVVVQFPSAEHARAWHKSEAYAAAMKIRHRASTGSLVLADAAP